MTTFDYLYEFSETRKVLEDFFRTTNDDDHKSIDDYKSETDPYNSSTCAYIGQRLANNSIDDSFHAPNSANNYLTNDSGYKTKVTANEIELYLDSNSQSSGELAGCADTTEIEKHINQQHTRHFTLSPESTDFGSNCGDLDGSLNDTATTAPTDYGRLCTSMPILEDGLSSGHASDTDNNNSSLAINVNAKPDVDNVENIDEEKKCDGFFARRSSALNDMSENDSKSLVIINKK